MVPQFAKRWKDHWHTEGRNRKKGRIEGREEREGSEGRERREGVTCCEGTKERGEEEIRKEGTMKRWRDGDGYGKMERWTNGKMEIWRDGEVERWKDGKMERWKDGKMVRW